ncbi:MAG: hypothetical protein ACI4R8_01985 [Candidatus Caccovivens sp.]
MSKKIRIILCAIALALVAITTGLCFVFLGNKVIKEVPSDLHIERIDDDFYLVTEYNSNYDYQFKLETQIDNEYLTVSVVDSNTNCLNLSKQNLSIIAGGQYRFSACFISNDGHGNGNYSQYLEWQPSWSLDSVQDVSFDKNTNILSWREVYLADSYEVSLTSFDGVQTIKSIQENHLDLNLLDAGVYKVFVAAKSNNPHLSSSVYGSGVEICVEKTNEIVSAVRDGDNNISILCSQNATEFEIYLNGSLIASVTTQCTMQGSQFKAFLKTDFLLSSVDFENNIVQVKSCEYGQVKESALVQIN